MSRAWIDVAVPPDEAARTARLRTGGTRRAKAAVLHE
jgi:hypothetical protein